MQVSTTPATAIAQLEALRGHPGRAFWPDDVPWWLARVAIVRLFRLTVLLRTAI
uniref:Ribonuclease VapC39 n=1 Tax=Mycobacterium riyadhense TaxID=486698 RepID=A0A653EU14_9MYCO|nr:Ribonuclease VapC39 [Mycobacterium riyadhense]